MFGVLCIMEYDTLKFDNLGCVWGKGWVMEGLGLW